MAEIVNEKMKKMLSRILKKRECNCEECREIETLLKEADNG